MSENDDLNEFERQLAERLEATANSAELGRGDIDGVYDRASQRPRTRRTRTTAGIGLAAALLVAIGVGAMAARDDGGTTIASNRSTTTANEEPANAPEIEPDCLGVETQPGVGEEPQTGVREEPQTTVPPSASVPLTAGDATPDPGQPSVSYGTVVPDSASVPGPTVDPDSASVPGSDPPSPATTAQDGPTTTIDCGPDTLPPGPAPGTVEPCATVTPGADGYPSGEDAPCATDPSAPPSSETETTVPPTTEPDE